jgi:hypothetical protein
MQVAVCDEYIATIDIKQYASDMDCFNPLMEKFNKQYGTYPKYPIADAGYGSYNNYLYCEQHVLGNNYGRTEEIYECESCEDCEYKQECCPKAKNNRTIKLNRELTTIHQEVLNNLCSIQGALLCMNRSIQAEGTFGIIKSDKNYRRLRRKGLENVILEFALISCGFNLYKYHNKKTRIKNCA